MEYRVDIIRKNVKNINLRITKEGNVRVTIPFNCSKRLALDFVNKKRSWIEGKIEKVKERNITPLINYTKEETLNVLVPILEKTLDLFREMPVKVTVREMKTRWGSCNKIKRKINLNTHLLNKDMRGIEYVIAHEVAHLKHANHSRIFWNWLEIHMPDYKDRKSLLK